MGADLPYFAVTPKGHEELLARELASFGADPCKVSNAGVAFDANDVALYRALMGSRLAGRILAALVQFEAPNADVLYKEAARLNWSRHLKPNGTLWVEVAHSHALIKHARFAAQRVKDAVVDVCRERFGERPSVDREDPDVVIHLALKGPMAHISIDLGGGSLHRRGYRGRTGPAPLKEHLAAAILMRAGWPQIGREGGTLVDPLCGSGTLVLEAAAMAADLAPGLLRGPKQPTRWLQFDRGLWEKAYAAAKNAADSAQQQTLPQLFGFDRDYRVLQAAQRAADEMGLGHMVHFEKRYMDQWRSDAAESWLPGLVVANPPYGERLGNLPEVTALYAQLGALLRGAFPGWKAGIFTGAPELGKHMGLRAHKIYKLYNGSLPCSLLLFDIRSRKDQPGQDKPGEGTPPKAIQADRKAGQGAKLSDSAQMFRNRLRKNLADVGKWAAKQDISCYRLYDADMPEFNLAIDRYRHCAVVWEYRAPTSVVAEDAERRLREALLVIPEVCGIKPRDLYLKTRARQKGAQQYTRIDHEAHRLEVRENQLRFWVNLQDYLDTGLFLDHRITRQRLREMANGKRFLNLFAYTASASVYAAAGGAKSTDSVDLSKNYLAWAQDNLELNGFGGGRHHFHQADCLTWLAEAARGKHRYDLIFLDPPTFSNSKRSKEVLEIQRDHIELIMAAGRLLAPKGALVFSNNFRKFSLDREALQAAGWSIEDWSAETIPYDFRRRPNIHHCFLLKRGKAKR